MENETERLVSDLFLFFKKASESFFSKKLSEVKACFQDLSIALNLEYNKNKLYKTWSSDIPNFDFLEKVLAGVSAQHFVNDFQGKCFSCYLLLTDRISLSDCLYVLR